MSWWHHHDDTQKKCLVFALKNHIQTISMIRHARSLRKTSTCVHWTSNSECWPHLPVPLKTSVGHNRPLKPWCGRPFRHFWRQIFWNIKCASYHWINQATALPDTYAASIETLEKRKAPPSNMARENFPTSAARWWCVLWQIWGCIHVPATTKLPVPGSNDKDIRSVGEWVSEWVGE